MWEAVMLNIAICDDEQRSWKRGQTFLEKWASDNRMSVNIDTYTHADDLFVAATTKRFHIIFLDIFMPNITGLDIARKMRSHNNDAQIIFVSSSPDFALESYEVRATNYLLKPVEYEKFCTVMNDAVGKILPRAHVLLVKSEQGYQRIALHDIEFIEARNKRVVFALSSGHEVLATEPLHFYEKILLGEAGFFKCHRSYVVSLDHVEHFTNTRIFTQSGREVNIARGLGKPFKAAYFDHLFAKGDVARDYTLSSNS